jgi:hypothetical protein
MLVLALVAGMPAVASAQFTTFIPPKNKVADSVKAAVVAGQKAQADSVAHTQLTNMRTWVDSAAGLVPTATTTADSLARVTATESTTTMVSGSRAPATASALPLLVLGGFVMLIAGALLVRGEPKRTRA